MKAFIIIDDVGTKIWAFTYNGSVPGPMIVLHEGDYLEFTLRNLSTNLLAHNVDFHAATGALGAGGITHIAPGEEVTVRFRATKAGAFIYHCAPGGVMIPWHVVHGMNGAITVLPRDGLKDGDGNRLTYDRAYFVGEQDFYIKKAADGTYMSYENAVTSQTDDLEVMATLIPSHIVFNGKVGALTGDNAMTATVGETVMFVHSQANYDTRPHIIGGHGDYVWERGSFDDAPQTNLETWFIAGGAAGANKMHALSHRRSGRPSATPAASRATIPISLEKCSSFVAGAPGVVVQAANTYWSTAVWCGGFGALLQQEIVNIGGASNIGALSPAICPACPTGSDADDALTQEQLFMRMDLMRAQGITDESGFTFFEIAQGPQGNAALGER